MDYFDGEDGYGAEEAIRDVVSQMFFMRPGIIESFDPATNTAKAIVAIQAKRIVDDKVKYITFPVIDRVPVDVPYSFGAGVCLTVPIRRGDPCMLVFSDRMMDAFLRTGTFSPPEDGVGPDNIATEPRAHHMADAVCIPGLITQRVGNKPGIIENWNNDAVELRNRDRTAFISLGSDRNIVMETTGNITMSAGGNVSVNGAAIRFND